MLQSRADDNAASGLLLGLFIALLAAGVGAALYFLSGDRTAPVAVPQIQKETTTEKETTIIERDNSQPAVEPPDVQVNVPEVSVPEVSAPEVNVPDVNITNEIPAEPAAEPAAPVEQPAEPAN